MELHEELDGLKNALFDFTKRNPLVHVQQKALWLLDDDQSDLKLPDRIYRKAQFFMREYGLETTLDVRLFIKWRPPQNSSKVSSTFLISPLFYFPAKIKRKRRQQTTYSVESLAEKGAINPIIQHFFRQWFGVEVPTDIGQNELIEFLGKAFPATSENPKIALVDRFTENDSWEIIQLRGVGNFNYKKNALRADYERMSPEKSSALMHLMGGGGRKELDDREVVQLDHLDKTQLNVVQEALNQNVVIQGPPGTGKSHTIVSLIGALLAADKKVLFVSEKRVALQVVQKRLTQIGFGHMTAFFNTQKDQKKSFYKRLNHSWRKCNESVDEEHFVDHTNAEHLSTIHLYQNEWFQFRSDLSGTYQDLIELLAAANRSIDELSLSGSIPTMEEWLKAEPFLLDFEHKMKTAFGENKLANGVFMVLNPAVFHEKQPINILEKRLVSLSHTLSKLKLLCKRYDLTIDFEGLIRLALTASVLNMVNQEQLDLLNKTSKKYRSFSHWAKKYATIKTKLKHAVKANEGWSKKPSMSEITELLDIIRHAEKNQQRGVFRYLKRNPARLKAAFRDFHSTISNHARIKLLESVQLEWRLQAERDDILVKFKHHFNITDPESEIDLIFNLRTRLDRVSSKDYVVILEHEKSELLIEDLAQIHPDLSRASSQLRFIFADFPSSDLYRLEEFVQEFQQNLPLINHWLPEIRNFYDFPENIRSTVQGHKRSIKELTAGVAYHSLMQAMRFKPAFKSLTGWELSAALKTEIQQEKQRFFRVRKKVQIKWKQRIHDLEKLSMTPAIGLKKEKKEKKKTYKKARRRLTHECHKKQRHMAVREFYEETTPFLNDLQPVWMMNPLTVAEYLPCQPELFDVVIFDESSQIPLEDAIPAIYRAKKVVVVGDSKQMPPGTFFSSRSEGVSLLNQADQTLKSTMLKWHYRSAHPALIEFSNRTFYENQLTCFPPINAAVPIRFRMVKDGVFKEGKNRVEAARLVEELADYFNTDKSIAVITFSLEQEKCIRQEMDKKGLEQRKVEVRNLENVQGTQADIVFLSMGYAPNEEGVFRQHFGPVNKENGANRLNVMFSRAKEKMIVFSSVTAKDFGWSDNTGVQVLRDFIEYCEHNSWDKAASIPTTYAGKEVHRLLQDAQVAFQFYSGYNGVNCFIHHASKKILIVDPALDTASADLVSYYENLTNRFEKVKLVLAIDFWLHRDRVTEEIQRFFVE